MVIDRLVDIEEEASNEVVNAQLAQFFGERRGVRDIEKHRNQLLTDRPMIGSEHDTGEQWAADQPRSLANHSHHQR
jgi:hypothetical protein